MNKLKIHHLAFKQKKRKIRFESPFKQQVSDKKMTSL